MSDSDTKHFGKILTGAPHFH